MLQANSHGEKGNRPLINRQIGLLALGANLRSAVGLPQETLTTALGALGSQGVMIRTVSSYYNTPAFPAGSGPDYVNAAAKVEFEGTAEGLLALVHNIEAELGRERGARWGTRTLDIDLLAIGDRVLPDVATYRHWHDLPLANQVDQAPRELILPHPRLQDRGFVLVPLAEVAPDWVHPVLQKSVKELLAALPKSDVTTVRRME